MKSTLKIAIKKGYAVPKTAPSTTAKDMAGAMKNSKSLGAGFGGEPKKPIQASKSFSLLKKK